MLASALLRLHSFVLSPNSWRMTSSFLPYCEDATNSVEYTCKNYFGECFLRYKFASYEKNQAFLRQLDSVFTAIAVEQEISQNRSDKHDF